MAAYQCRTQFEAHDDGIWSVAWAANGQVVTGSCDELVQTMMVHGLEIEKKHELRGHRLSVTSVSVSSVEDGCVAASSSLDSYIRLWDLERGVQAAKQSPAAKQRATGVHIRAIDAGPLEAWTVSLSPDSSTIVSGSQGGNVNLWSFEDGVKLSSMPAGGKFIMSVAFSPDGKRVAFGAEGGAVGIFDCAKEKLVANLSGHAMSVRTLAFSNNGALLLTGSDDAHLNLYDMQSASQVGSFEGHGSWVLGCAFSPDDSHIASCGTDNSVRTWDVGTRQFLQKFDEAHSDQVWGVAFDPQGGRFCSVSDDKTVRLFELESP